ncbi:MAG: hypothetical protein JNN32_11070 [Flavobacteriales bacterium]|nr:hypothetical protein [Flavobacteriales bacterium]
MLHAMLLALFVMVVDITPVPLVTNPATYEFGFSLNHAGTTDRQYTLFIYKVHDGHVIESTVISEKAFILQAAGLENSRANPLGIDLFEQYAIAECEAHRDSLSGDYAYRCSPLNDLWRLRYGGATSNTSSTGWAQDLNAPGIRQQIILQAYRSPHEDHWLGPYFGAKAFALLKDIQDPTWVATYRDGR